MFNPAIASKNIKEEFISYITTSFSFANSNLRTQFINELNKQISSGPWLEINDVFKSGKSISQLMEEGILSSLFKELEIKKPYNMMYKRILPLDRPLYLHQEKAIRSIVSGKNAVISTGTGSGKTNCFLIPVLNDLLKEKEQGLLGPGIRALFIYPMNALANDQMKNIRNILMFYPSITFGVYNGATESGEDEAIKVYKAMFANEQITELREGLPNELLSREEMKNNPPHILFTNYAMLEHLLFRPKDDVLFSNSNFKFVVLDEAHVYSGATGIETAILLRRLKARINSYRDTQFILTSATLGNSSKYDTDIITFAENLCGVKFYKENIIRGERVKHINNNELKKYPIQLIKELADDKNSVKEVLIKYGIIFDSNGSESEILYDFVNSSELYGLLRDKLSNITTLDEIENILGLDNETAISFIMLCTRSQKNGKLLVDARYHFFIRSLEGCFITLNKEQKLYLTRQKYNYSSNTKFVVFEIALCDDCGKYAIVGKEEDGKIVQSNKYDDDIVYFFLASDENTEIDDEDNIENKRLEHYSLCPHCATLVPDNEKKQSICDCKTNDYIKVVKAKNLKTGSKCGNCHTGNYKRFYLGNDAATSVLATSLYEELPELVYEEANQNEGKSTNLFAIINKENKKTVKRIGRQFLAFSDSRQEAAKFACYLGKSYDEFLRRRGICQIIKDHSDMIINNTFTISDFVSKLTSFFASKRSFSQSYGDSTNLTTISRKNAWLAMLNELARFNSSTSLTSLGLLQFKYIGNTPEIINGISERYNVSKNNVECLLDLLIFEIIKMGAICTDDDSDIDDNDREYIFYTPSQKFVAKIQSPGKNKSTVKDWLPKNRNGKIDEFYKTNRLYYVCKFLNIDNKEAYDFLSEYFDYLCDKQMGNEYCLVDKNKDGTYVLPAKYFQLKISGDKNAKWYKCSKCGKISTGNFDGKCIIIGCNGIVIETNAKELGEHNHYSKLYYSERMSPLFIKEHTAQLSKKESARYQEQFIKKEINALSCSTTFEMGVDVGDLETVFLRDVPPLPSNYAQRAGRAGRSINAAAYALTFAKLSSHDLSFFKEPKKMINGLILPPIFKVDNEKIVSRHVYAVALSLFFSIFPDYYNHNDSNKFINEKGYLDFIKWINTKPNRLKEILVKSIPNVDDLHTRLGINDFSWINSLCGIDGVFTTLIREYENNIKQFESLIKKFKEEDDLEKALKCERKLNIYKRNKLIDFLARGNILPRYGFPVNTVELEQNVTANNINKLRLSRDLQIAIAEYAPSSEIIADGKLYTSRYIKKPNFENKDKEWYTAYICECDDRSCKAMNYSITHVDGLEFKCVSCGKILSPVRFSESIEPRSGFVTDREAKEVPLSRQEKNYKSEDFYIGNTESKTIDKYAINLNNITVTLESTSNDSLLVKSSNDYYVCEKCGFAYAEDENITGDKIATQSMLQKKHKINTTAKHESLFGQYSCNCQELHRYSLHHTFSTDVVKISFGCDTSDYNTMLSSMYAILYGICNYLNIERKDIKGCLTPKIINKRLSYSIIIYDSVPGGAGHSRRLVTPSGDMLYNIIENAVKIMRDCSCDPSCYNCLRSYENQLKHDILDRKLAENFLSKMLDKQLFY